MAAKTIYGLPYFSVTLRLHGVSPHSIDHRSIVFRLGWSIQNTGAKDVTQQHSNNPAVYQDTNTPRLETIIRVMCRDTDPLMVANDRTCKVGRRRACEPELRKSEGPYGKTSWMWARPRATVRLRGSRSVVAQRNGTDQFQFRFPVR